LVAAVARSGPARKSTTWSAVSAKGESASLVQRDGLRALSPRLFDLCDDVR
jgi:hypothetical protein